jgi:hypothetical protein
VLRDICRPVLHVEHGAKAVSLHQFLPAPIDIVGGLQALNNRPVRPVRLWPGATPGRSAEQTVLAEAPTFALVGLGFRV